MNGPLRTAEYEPERPQRSEALPPNICYCQSIIHFDAGRSDRAVDFGVTGQQPHGSQVTIAPGNQRCVRPPERMGAEDQLMSLLGRLALRCASW